MLPEFTSPVSKAFILAALTEWAIPRSSACTIKSFVSAEYPSRSASDRVLDKLEFGVFSARLDVVAVNNSVSAEKTARTTVAVLDLFIGIANAILFKFDFGNCLCP